jgi:hypothetical protein
MDRMTCPDCGGPMRHKYIPGAPALECANCQKLIEVSLNDWLRWTRLEQERVAQRIRESEEALRRSRKLLRDRKPP